MQIITTREFRANQKKYFELAEQETILIQRRNKAPILISVPSDDDFLTAKEIECIKRGREEFKAGKTHEIHFGENLDDFLLRMQKEGHVQG